MVHKEIQSCKLQVCQVACQKKFEHANFTSVVVQIQYTVETFFKKIPPNFSQISSKQGRQMTVYFSKKVHLL